jgi:predicted HicB family RNase H-like nuclease
MIPERVRFPRMSKEAAVRRRGRPPSPPESRFSVGLRIMVTPAQAEAFARLAKDANKSLSQWARDVFEKEARKRNQ